mgnify:FL=1
MAELSQKQLEEMVVGKPQQPRVFFYERAVLNARKSREQNRRVYDNAVYIAKRQPGVTDHMDYHARKKDIDEWPNEYQEFLDNKQGLQKPGVEIIPNLSTIHLQELRDMGILNIEQLAELNVVPAHLDYARAAAVALYDVLKEQRDGPEEESIEEDILQTHAVPPQAGRDEPHHVRQREAPGGGREHGREARQGHEAPRRIHRGQGVDWSQVRIA